ncbi:allantoinase [Mycolicibacterium canariasense]|uniref:allantoinase n=1 Tax=Mycolicibacterium canariasense TaxID=228230 RepID=A0A117I9Q0_MYCCR|nr:allantoinase AllB [Mycolicibacterium canariasense]MCV7209396.1 allantoinase AllB [Mycolicibacterium canariasense]ORV05789.1 cyclic amidohydrolase [Mycolicibacterium canariasense]GAS95070.1 allantoinase [Mycolicibacterium canariasense]
MDCVLRAERVLVDGHLVPASVGITGGVIAFVGAADANHPAAQDVRLPERAVLLPGFVDTHVHIDDPGTDWEGFATATAAAAAAGITTLVDMPLDCRPVTTSVAALEVKEAAAAGNCHVDVGYWGGVVPGNLDELGPLARAGVRGFKCFLADSGNPDFPHLSTAEFRDAMGRIAELDSVLLVHAESPAVLDGSPRPNGRDYRSFLASRPDAAEQDAVGLVIDTARATGARAHIVHVSSAAVIPSVAAARADGLAVTAETCPHYLTFGAEAVPDGGTEFAVCPPIRAGANREALWAALADGTLDLIVSDHSPCTAELKAGGDFGRAFGGISSLQLGPRAVWTQAGRRGFGLPELSRWMSEGPAALAGYADRGRIAVGLRADLCAFDPDAQETVRAAELWHRHPVSPYDGMSLRGAVLQTWVAGVPALARIGEPV